MKKNKKKKSFVDDENEKRKQLDQDVLEYADNMVKELSVGEIGQELVKKHVKAMF